VNPLATRARAEFFLRIGQRGRTDDRQRDDYTLPLWPLPLILEADGTLSDDARHLLAAELVK